MENNQQNLAAKPGMELAKKLLAKYHEDQKNRPQGPAVRLGDLCNCQTDEEMANCKYCANFGA